MPVKIFISYSHKEPSYKDKLVESLRELETNGSIRIWTDRDIIPGQEWNKVIVDALHQADLIIFLISESFISSRYIKEIELKDAVERCNRGEVMLIPIVLKNREDLKSLPLKIYQDLPTGNIPVDEWKPVEGAYSNIKDGIRRSIELISPKLLGGQLRELYKKAKYDDIFKELDRISRTLESKNPDLFNTFLNMNGEWKKIKLDEIRKTRDYEQKKRDFLYQLIDFIGMVDIELNKS